MEVARCVRDVIFPSAVDTLLVNPDTDTDSEEIFPSAVDTRVVRPDSDKDNEEISPSLSSTLASILSAVCCSVETLLDSVVILPVLLSTSCVTSDTVLVSPSKLDSSSAAFVVSVVTFSRKESVSFCSFHAVPFHTYVRGGDLLVSTHSCPR